MSASSDVVHVCVTGAAGQIGYSLIQNICKGEMFGASQKIVLHLLDIAPAMEALGGVVMEIEDCNYELVVDVIATADVETAFTNVDAALLVGAFPRREGMVRADLLKKNVGIFKEQGAALSTFAKPDVKIIVVGNPCNSNAYTLLQHAPNLGPQNVGAMTFLDSNRLTHQLVARIGADPTAVKNVIVWGNHSKNLVPDTEHAVVVLPDGTTQSVTEAVADQAYLEGDLVSTIQGRGAAIIKARKFSSAASAAKAITDNMRTWWSGTPDGQWMSMGVASDGSYGIDEGIVFSFPLTVDPDTKQWSIVQGLEVSDFIREKMTVSLEELRNERAIATELLASSL